MSFDAAWLNFVFKCTAICDVYQAMLSLEAAVPSGPGHISLAVRLWDMKHACLWREDSRGFPHEVPETDTESQVAPVCPQWDHRDHARSSPVIVMPSLGTSPDWTKTSQRTRLSMPRLTYHSVAHPTRAGSVDPASPAAGGSTRSGRTTTCHLPICGDAQSDVVMGRHYGPGWLHAKRRRQCHQIR